jgi:gamma-glutamylcysteine synthetase
MSFGPARRFFARRRFLFGLFGNATARHAAAEVQHDVIIERTGVRLLIGDAQFRQQLQNDVRLDLEFSSQLVDANFTHT